jgi:hypothetical protein
MKGLLRFLLLGALFLGVASLTAHSTVHKVEVSKSFSHEFQPMALTHTEVIIERVDNEVLVIQNENAVVKDLSKPVIAVAHAPPETI